MPVDKFQPRFIDEASADFLDALSRYSERDLDVAESFNRSIANAVSTIRDAPKRWPIKDGSHRFILRRFPYTIAYYIDVDIIWIVAVAHHSRDPASWIHRR